MRLLATTPGWKESNFQVMNKCFEVIAAVAAKSDKMSKKVTK